MTANDYCGMPHGMPAETTASICEVIFGGLLERFPRLKLCFAHGAGSFPYTVGRIQHGFDVRPDLCAVDNKAAPKSYLGEIYADSLVHGHGALKLLLDTLGEDRVMLGSDYPYPLGEIERPGRLIETSGFQDSVKEKLLWKNAASFLGIEMTPEGVRTRT
ncbi:2-amino-3-carboxymuconate-6-semialdehyde decarboxylase-like [Dermacentor silvarum]|uniref:2-amino-3-carboxymuconate-6-semialdehyde decarboxylase-like n=1 Tax=Dermacentor silvarum TaxID=543639 RepID=UPI001899708E|nr:2-amino-3-carboxymuconate-6-semialdehyde decarboxylase-like [Dermacentor silvarum]